MNFEEEDYYFDHDDLNDVNVPLSDSESSDHEDKPVIVNLGMIERVNMINKRSKIDSLKENVKKMSDKYQRIKDELLICENQMMELKKEEEMTFDLIKNSKLNGNLAASYRLEGQLKRINLEIEGEKDLHNLIKQRLVDAERDFIKSQLEEGKYIFEDKNLKEEEMKYNEIQEKRQTQRLNNEQKLTKNAKRSLEWKKRESEKTLEEQNNQKNELEKSIAEAHLNHSVYLQKTIKEQKDEKVKAEKEKIDKQKKTEESLKKLNSDIHQTKENMIAINSKRKAEKEEEIEKEKNLQLSTIEKGGNPKLELKKYKNNIKLSETNDQFLKNVKEGKVKIAEKINGESLNMIKKKKLLPYLFEEPQKLERKSLSADVFINNKKIIENIKASNVEEWKMWDIRSSAGRSSVKESSDIRVLDNIISNSENLTKKFNNNVQSKRKDEGDEDINSPEFHGMWNTTIDYKVPKDMRNLHIKDENASKMDQEIMERVLNQLKENIVQPQVVGGKHFKGKSFQSKPEVIQFTDLEVGEIYTQKIILINTSYGTNQCRFERITEHLIDFITIKFSPSGPLSPGMTFEFTVIFEPKLSQDLYGEVFFTSQSERFSIPLICLTKKCKMTIDKQLVQFNTSVIGEILVQSIFLKNSGAKGTFCWIHNKRNTISTEVENNIEENDDEKMKEVKEMSINEYECITTSIGNNKLWIDPYKEQEVIIKWSPITAEDYVENFFISFEDEDNKGFDLQVLAKAIDVPVYIADPVISMDICMINRLYQDTIVFHSRAATALKMTFKIPNEIRDYLEILPNMGFIQAGQQFKAQLKLIVKSSFYKDNCPFFDSETGILDVPVSVAIANQMKTVDFNVQAVLTVTDLEISSLGSDPSIIDFGYCTINETKIKSLKLFNKAILPQEFGFTGFPEYVEIQPNHGYGIILPKEELIFHVLFSPKKAENFQFQVRCQTLIDRSFSLSCIGVGVHPSLEISKQIINFPHTAMNDVSIVDIFLLNSHTSMNIYTHEPPRIGTETVVPVGPKTYNILLPENIAVSVHPRVGTIDPGEKQKLSLFFKPKLTHDSIKKEAAKIIFTNLEIEAKRKWVEEIKKLESQKDLDSTPQLQQQSEKEEIKPKKSSKKPNRPLSDNKKDDNMLNELVKAGPLKVPVVDPEEIVIDSNEYLKARLSLLQKTDFNFEIIKAKCVIANGKISESDKLKYDLRNVIDLELHCPSVKPDLVILSNNGRSLIDFGRNILNNRVTKTVSFQNISGEVIKLKSSSLDANGAYQICNALREIESNAVANIVISFCATEEGIYETNWSISGINRKKTLKLRFRSETISPRIEIKEMKNGVINMGVVMINEYVEKPITLINNSEINIRYKLNLSQKNDSSSILGVHNKSGLSAFTLTSHSGVIEAGKSKTVLVTFAPDHESLQFRTTATLLLFEKVELLKFIIQGEAKKSVLYLKSSKICIERSLEYLGEIWINNDKENEEKPEVNNQTGHIVLILQSTLSKEGTVIEGKAVFIIGCVRTMAVSQKKNGEFSIDNINVLTTQGFNVDFVKGQIEADSEKEIMVSWIPTHQYEIGTVISSSLNITLKGDTLSSYIIELRAYVK